MAMLVKTKPFEYNASFVKCDSPAEYKITGTVYENDEDGALAAIERMYMDGKDILKSVRVVNRWEKDSRAVTRYVAPPKEEAEPKFHLGMIEGMEFFIDYAEVEVKPFTYKEKSNDD
jgi:hypothetical protein